MHLLRNESDITFSTPAFLYYHVVTDIDCQVVHSLYMFKRVLSNAYLCPICRRNKLLQDPKSAVNYIHKRWQNTAARAAPNDVDNVDEETRRQHVVRQSRSSSRYRHWRPTPTAQLGVDALGQPAEILILPKSRHHSPKSEINDQDDGVDDALQTKTAESPILETIAGDSKSPSTEEIRKHIHTIKRKHQKPEGQLRYDEWVQMQKALAKSFNVKQLMQYYDEELGTGKDSKDIKSYSRSSMAQKIMKDVWRCTDITQKKQEQAPLQQPKMIHRTEHAKLFILNQQRLRAMQVIEPAVELMQITGKSIQFFGPADAVERTTDLLRAYESKVAHLLLPIPANLRSLFSTVRAYHTETYPTSDDLKDLQDLVVRSGVVLRSGDNNGLSTKIYGLDDAHIKVFLQQLMLWMKSVASSTAALPLLSCQPAEVCNLPVAVEKPHQSTSLWQRYVLKKPIESKHSKRFNIFTNPGGEHLISTILKTSIGPQDHLSHLAAFNSSVHQVSTYSTEIGIAVFGQNSSTVAASSDMNSDRDKSEDEVLEYPVGEDKDTTAAGEGEQTRPDGTVRSTMITNIPLLAQFLAQQQTFSPAHDEVLSRAAEVAEPETLVHLIYTCPDVRYPSVEIYASVDKSKVEVKSVTCPLSSVCQHLAFPSHVVDLKVVKTISTSLYQYGVPLETGFLPFIASLAGVLNSSITNEAGKVTKIDPLIQLDLSSLAKRISANSQGLLPEENSILEERGMKAVSYILSTAEQVEYTTYKTAAKSSFLLEHLMFTPLHDMPDQTSSQVLRVVEKPLLWHIPTERSVTSAEDGNNIPTEKEWEPKMIGSDQNRFDAFMKAAHSTVIAIDRFTIDKRRSIVEASTRVEENQEASLARSSEASPIVSSG